MCNKTACGARGVRGTPAFPGQATAPRSICGARAAPQPAAGGLPINQAANGAKQSAGADNGSCAFVNRAGRSYALRRNAKPATPSASNANTVGSGTKVPLNSSVGETQL